MKKRAMALTGGPGKRPPKAWLLGICLAFLLAACSGEKKSEPQAGTKTFTDSAGRRVEVPAAPAKVSPTGALAQMYLAALAPELLVTSAGTYTPEQLAYLPAQLASLPMVGQFYGSQDLNLETIANAGPQLIIDIGEAKKTIAQDMDSITGSLAIPAVHITATLRSTPEAFRSLGRLLDREAQGEALAQYCEGVLSQTDRIMAQREGDKPSILYCLGDSGLSVLAATTFHAEVLDYIAGNMAAVDNPASRGSGNETDLEQILLWNPDYILFSPKGMYSQAAADPVWSQLKAIRRGTYYEAPAGPYNWLGMPPSINRYLGMLWLTKLLYPDRADFDLYEQVREYYRLFYHHDLTQDEFEALTARSLPKEAGR
ncbi:MAG: ABC transporter substrate-binding protein [Treponema sp.]|jgi:iron complex transport system substrate-binding protein|nr:ABC transporter substrate-binding protein [Treponema sp.]